MLATYTSSYGTACMENLTSGTYNSYNLTISRGYTDLNIRYGNTYPTTACSINGLTYSTTTSTLAGSNIIKYAEFYIPTLSFKPLIKELMHMRVTPRIYTHANPLGFTKDLREIRARETLHKVLGDDGYKSFLKKGFISVMAKSGLVYQIFPGGDFTKVYNRGIMIDRYCVVLQGGFPPTDSLIMRYLLILNNEKMFESFAIKHGSIKIDPSLIATQDNRNLLEIFKEQKRQAA